MLKKDNWWLGVALGALLPLVFYGLIMLILNQWGTISEGTYVLKPSTSKLLALFANFISFRYYMINLKYDKTGRGILLITFAYAAIYFYLYI